MLRHMFVRGPRRTVVTVLGDEKRLKRFSEEFTVAVFGTPEVLDVWDATKFAPEPEFEAERAAGEIALDVLTARQEFKTAGSLVQSGVEERQATEVVKGIGMGVLVAGSFVLPWGRGGRVLAGGLRGQAGTLGRFAAGELTEAVPARVTREAFAPDVSALDDAALGELSTVLDTLRSAGVRVPEGFDTATFNAGFLGLGDAGRSGGFTFNPTTAQSVYETGYGTAIARGYTMQVPIEQFSTMDVVNFLQYRPAGTRFTVAEVLARDPRNAIGGWVSSKNLDSPHVWLDVSRVVPTKDEAFRIAGALNEEAIIDFQLAKRTGFEETDLPIPKMYQRGGARYLPDAIEDFSDPSILRSYGPYVEQVKTQDLVKFRDKARSGPRVKALVEEIKTRGIREALVLEVGRNGRALLTDGNHRLAAAIEAGLDTVPVRTVISETVQGGAPVNLGTGARAGYVLPPSVATDGQLAPLRPEVPGSLLRREGGFDAEISGVRARELAERMAERHLNSPSGLSALDVEDIAAVMVDSPDFNRLMRLYRSGMPMGERSLASYARVLDREGAGATLSAFGRRIGAEPVPGATAADTDLTLLAVMSGPEGDAIKAAAVNLAHRIKNLNVFVTDDIYSPTFYAEFNRIIRRASERTGLPEEVYASALASSSAQASPYDEINRLAAMSRYVTVKDGVAVAKPGTPEFTDTMQKSSLYGLIDVINNPNFLGNRPMGMAMKTQPYAYSRLDPLFKPAYVADTVDQLGQFLIAGTSATTNNPIRSIMNQFAGRTLANIYGVSPSAMQEALWSHIRLARDGMKVLDLKQGMVGADALAPSFNGPRGSAEDILVDIGNSLDPKVLALAKKNRDAFYQQVQDGRVREWVWDPVRNRPVISSSDYLIPSDKILEAGGRNVNLQRVSFETTSVLGAEFRAKLLALAAVLGIPASVLTGALVGSGEEIPDEVLFGGTDA